MFEDPGDLDSEAFDGKEAYTEKLENIRALVGGLDTYYMVAVATKKLTGENGRITKLHAVRLDWKQDDKGQWKPTEIPGSEFTVKADLVLLAMGYVHPVHEGLLKELGVGLDSRGNVQATDLNYQTSVPKVFAAGDMRRGQSLVVWAIREGRQCARAVDEFLTGHSDLPR